MLFADITGYESYMEAVEIEHASNVVQELLELIIEMNAPPLKLATLHGDGVLMYVPHALLDRGEVILELTEVSYLSFKDRLQSIDRNNTCDCRACSAAPDLDLKFFVHYGEFLAVPSGEERMELAGLDAILLRERLLKDQVEGVKEPFVLFTATSFEQLDLPLKDTIKSKAEYPHYGEIAAVRVNLTSRYAQMLKERRIRLDADRADLDPSILISASPIRVWEWLNNPHLRTRWMRARTWTELKRPRGRLGIDAQNHCSHALGDIVETILDWRPYEYFSSENRQGPFHLQQTFSLHRKPEDKSIAVHWYVRILRAPLGNRAKPLVARLLQTVYQSDLRVLKDLIENENRAL